MSSTFGILVTQNCPEGVPAPCGSLTDALGIHILTPDSSASEFAGGVFPRYPMTLSIETGGVVESMSFVTVNGLQEGPFTKKSTEFRSAWDFNSGLVLPSAQGGVRRGLETFAFLDNAKYPWQKAGFDVEDVFQWPYIYSRIFVSLSSSWWNSICASSPDCPSGIGGPFAQASFTIKLVDGSGYKTEHVVYLDMYSAPPSPPLSASIAISGSEVSGGTDLTCSATVSGGTPPYVLTWTFPDGYTAVSDETGTSHTLYNDPAYAHPITPQPWTILCTVTSDDLQSVNLSETYP